MNRIPSILALASALALSATAATAQNILFVGNSFTFTPRPLPVGEVTELNGSPVGGVPALFQALSKIGGKNPVVTMETVGGKHLEFHYTEKLDLINKPWDIVVLQDYSTGPLIEKGDTKSYDSFREFAVKLRDTFVAQNPGVKIYAYETWGRPDRVMRGTVPSIEFMHDGLHKAYTEATHDFGFTGWVPVGCAFTAAVHEGIADNPATADVVEGPLKIWGKDNYHQSVNGSYLAALMFYGRIYGADPRELPSDNPAAQQIGLSPEDGKKLQDLAWEQLQANP